MNAGWETSTAHPAPPKAVGPTAGGAEDCPQQAHTQYSSQSTSRLAETPPESTHTRQKLYSQKHAHPSTITPTESTKHSYTAQFLPFFARSSPTKQTLYLKKQLKNPVFRLYASKTPIT
jgi:hypothetical protein